MVFKHYDSRKKQHEEIHMGEDSGVRKRKISEVPMRSSHIKEEALISGVQAADQLDNKHTKIAGNLEKSIFGITIVKSLGDER